MLTPQPSPKQRAPGVERLPRGIISVVQTPFDREGGIDEASLERLLDDAIAAGVHGLLAPVVASEVACLSHEERLQIMRRVATMARGRVPFIVGASAEEPERCRALAALGAEIGAAAFLVAVPAECYRVPERLVPFFVEATKGAQLPLVIQDLQWGGPGLDLGQIQRLRDALPGLAGVKVETLPAGSKYTAVRQAFGSEFFIAGGWAVTQMIEALDRGVDAMIPESSMVRAYVAIYRHYAAGQRQRARDLFQSLVPVLAFTNQNLATSIAFFKRLLVRKGIFAESSLRLPGFHWDTYNTRIADELIDSYLELERRITSSDSAAPDPR